MSHCWSAQGQAGWGSGKPGLEEGLPAHGKGVGTRWPLRSLPLSSFYDYLVCAKVPVHVLPTGDELKLLGCRGCVSLSCASPASRDGRRVLSGRGDGGGVSPCWVSPCGVSPCRVSPCRVSRLPWVTPVMPYPRPPSSSRRSLSPRAAPQGTRPRAAVTAQAPPRPAEPSRHCRVGRGRFAIRRRTGTRFSVLIFFFFPLFPHSVPQAGRARSPTRSPAEPPRRWSRRLQVSGAGPGGRGSAHGSPRGGRGSSSGGGRVTLLPHDK